jgi:hypothetical protein
VREARNESMRLSRRHVLSQVEPAEVRAIAFPVTLVGGAPPSVAPLEERVQKLARDVEALGRRLDREAERHVQDHRAMTKDFAGWIAEARREVFDLRNELRPLIGKAAAGNLWQRAIGVGLFALGVVVQMIANLASL